MAGAELVFVSGNVLAPPEPQVFAAFTEISPPLKVTPKFTVMELVVEVPVAPAGNVH